MLGSAPWKIFIRITNMGKSLKNSKLTMSFTNLQRILMFCYKYVMHIWGNPVGLSSHQVRDPTGRNFCNIPCIPLGEDMTLVALGVVALF
jgi:hypothetical protein